ncbi:Ig-like domain-containing protein [Eubacterium limosum]|uniref:Ig-like domain-containing protein n=1 Tax=Eubacterium limosum TaxID=1736 RepID=UPI001D0788D0|nr:Ig-like domain-containing protein [Eubacterium limosum]MCB6569256.1 Ig-like domain-containing protein [Eubacterium limosum]
MAVNTVKATINGQQVTLTYNATSKKYEGTTTAPAKSSFNQANKYYPVTIVATDVAGNSVTVNDQTSGAIGAACRLTVKEKIAPVIAITSPGAGAILTNNKPTITWTVTDNDSGVNSGSIGITIDSGSKITSGITKTAITGGYSCSYTPTTALSDGSHTIKVDASDNDGNAGTQKSTTFKIDTVPPTLNVTAPANGLVTKTPACTVTGTTNDTTSSPCTVTVKLNSGTAQAVTVNSDGSFSKALTLVEGSNTIVVVSTDAAGKSSTVTRTVTLDTVAPVITAVELIPNPADAGATYTIKVTVIDA